MAETLTLVAAPAQEPVTLAEIKAHRRVAHAAEDALLMQLVAAARRRVEADAGVKLVAQTWDWTLDGWPAPPAWLPLAPLLSVDEVTYLDADGAPRTLDADRCRVAAGTPGRIEPAPGLAWPAARRAIGAVTIRLTAGYGDAADVPEEARVAILLLAGLLYENREAAQEPAAGRGLAEVPLAYTYLIDALRPGIYR